MVRRVLVILALALLGASCLPYQGEHGTKRETILISNTGYREWHVYINGMRVGFAPIGRTCLRIPYLQVGVRNELQIRSSIGGERYNIWLGADDAPGWELSLRNLPEFDINSLHPVGERCR